jgi:hypothetical protein
MPERSIDPETGEPALAYRENKFFDPYIASGGNGQQAAVQAASVLARLQGIDSTIAAAPD